MNNFTKSNSIKYLLTTVFALFLMATTIQTAKAQDDGGVSISPGMDIVSTYVWRGTAYSGPSLQPYIELSAGGFTLGAWGSQGIDGIMGGGASSVGFQEMDAYVSYRFDFGLSLGVTDYYYPPADFSDDVHAFELNAGYTTGDFSLSGNYIFAGGGSIGDDVYFQVDYDTGPASLFIGGGDGWHLEQPGDFNIVNVGVSTSKEIEITDTFSLPVFGSVIVNPEREVFYITAGLSL